MDFSPQAQLAAPTVARICKSIPFRDWPKHLAEGHINERDLKTRRRVAVQRLLQSGPKTGIPALIFTPGRLLEEQAYRREAGRKAARARDERALTARITKNALSGVQRQLGIEVPKPGQKRRGRPPKGTK